MKNETTFATIGDVSRYVNAYHKCFIGNGMCAPFNRDVLRGWMRELELTNAQINAFCNDHGIPLVA